MLPIEMYGESCIRLFLGFMLIPLLYCAYDCLDRPDSDFRSCISHKLETYEDKVEKERILWTKTQVSTITRCFALCLDDQQCVSYFYNKNSKTCTGHSIMFGNATAALSETGSTFYYLDDGRYLLLIMEILTKYASPSY